MLSQFNWFFFSLIFCLLFCSNVVSSQVDVDEPVKCHTFEILKNPQKQKYLDRVLVEFDSTGRPRTQCVVHSKTGRFAVHYDTSGTNQVPKLDLDRNGIPDFVDSALFYLEYSYKVIIDTMGFAPPPQDSGKGGSDAWDFYLLQLGVGYYYDVAYGFTMVDLEVKDTTLKPFPRYTAFSILDNDFSPYDSTFFENGTKKPTYRETGYLGLKITLAHEFHHIVQFGYGDPSFPSFNEMTSTFIEFRVFTQTRDYLQYVRSLLNNFSKYIFSENNYLNGYRYAIYLQYLQKKFGDLVIRNLWQRIGEGLEPFIALNETLKPYGSSVAASLSDFLAWIYYSGPHYREGFLPNAREFPRINYLDTFRFSPPTMISSKLLKPFEIRPVQFIFPSSQFEVLDDTMDILLVNVDFESASKRLSNTVEYTLIVSSEPFTFSRQLYPKNYYYLCKSDSNLVVDSIFINFGYQTFIVAYPFPNPTTKSDENVYFPVPENTPVGENVELTIYGLDFKEIPLNQKAFPVTLSNKIRVIKVNPQLLMKSGVFFFKTSYKGSSIFGKFSVIK